MDFGVFKELFAIRILTTERGSGGAKEKLKTIWNTVESETLLSHSKKCEFKS